MKEKIDFAKVPYQYAMCLNRQCPQANTCLRQLTEQSVQKISSIGLLSVQNFWPT